MYEDQHFLSRIERLTQEHAELALGLYYDTDLVKHVLSVANIAEGAERVALSLNHPEDGPFIIVTRGGHFVTCLGEGMRRHEDQPVITRDRLDKISESAESLRSLMVEASSGRRRQTVRKLSRIHIQGDRLAREDFLEAARWLPLLGPEFLCGMVGSMTTADTIFLQLASAKKLGRRHEEHLHAYWQSSWAASHYATLLASDGGRTLRKMVAYLEDEEPGSASLLPGGLVRSSVNSFAARGMWLASKLAGTLLPTIKRKYTHEACSFFRTISDGLSLLAIGLRHHRYRSEIRKTLARPPVSSADADSWTIVRKAFAEALEHHLTDPTPGRQAAVGHAREVLRRTLAAGSSADGPQDAPEDVALAHLLSIPFGLYGKTEGLRGLGVLCTWAPAIVGMQAASFYMPKHYVKTLRGPWVLNEGLRLIQPRRLTELHRPAPTLTPTRPGRNAVCPCGSGSKFKRCCGRPQALP